MIRILNVDEGSYASGVGISPGDVILSVNGQKTDDQLDVMFHLEEGDNELLLEDGRKIIVNIPWPDLDVLGVEVEPFSVKHCRSKCIFCFIDQLPPGLRSELYLKDDDYRLSFLEGSFITGENLSRDDITKIFQLRLSPLYISVHATDPMIRGTLLGKRGREAPIIPLLKELNGGGIEIHAQIGVCPDFNDGSTLRMSLKDLLGNRGLCRSVGVVPVGLTKFRKKLPEIRAFRKNDAISVLKILSEFQDENDENGFTVMASDEIYLKAGAELPDFERYGDFPQLGNGVGMIRWWEQIFFETTEILKDIIDESGPGQLKCNHQKIIMITGEAAFNVINRFSVSIAAIFGKTCEAELKVLKVINRFLGESISTASLLSGRDMVDAIEKEIFESLDSLNRTRVDTGSQFVEDTLVLLPPFVFNEEGFTLDGYNLERIERECNVECAVATESAEELAYILADKLVSGLQDHQTYEGD